MRRAHRPTSSRSSLMVTVPVSLTNANRGRTSSTSSDARGSRSRARPFADSFPVFKATSSSAPVVDHEPDRDDVRLPIGRAAMVTPPCPQVRVLSERLCANGRLPRRVI
jgi:hypothetical protein